MILAWDGIIKASSLQDIVIGGVLNRIAVALEQASYKKDIFDIVEQVCSYSSVH